MSTLMCFLRRDQWTDLQRCSSSVRPVRSKRPPKKRVCLNESVLMVWMCSCLGEGVKVVWTNHGMIDVSHKLSFWFSGEPLSNVFEFMNFAFVFVASISWQNPPTSPGDKTHPAVYTMKVDVSEKVTKLPGHLTASSSLFTEFHCIPNGLPSFTNFTCSISIEFRRTLW